MTTPLDVRPPQEVKRNISVNLRPSVIALADRVAKQTNRSRSEVVDIVLADALARYRDEASSFSKAA